MGSLTGPGFEEAALALFEAACDPFGWPEALRRLGEALGADLVLLAHLDLADLRGGFWHAGGDADVMRDFAARFGKPGANPHMHHYFSVPVGTVVRREDVEDDATWEASPLYREIFLPQGLYDTAGVCVVRDREALGMLRLARLRERGAFRAAELERLSAFVPYLQRALRIHARIHHLRRERATMARALHQLALGVVTVDYDGSVVWKNETARALIAREDGLAVRRGRLVANRPEDTRALDALIRSATQPSQAHGGGALAIRRSTACGPYAALVVPLVEEHSPDVGPLVRGAAAVFLTDPESRPGGTGATLRELYGLTEAEATVAAQLVGGRSRREIAEQLGVSLHAVRFHLGHIFTKTGTRRQAELVRLLMRSGPGAWAP
jgi:DNA-binding CsgD family transcriptional regulator